MPNNTNASDSLFGWDFQINAAIVIMLEDIINIEKVRVEGETEDIEISMHDGGILFSQAKALTDPTKTDNVRSKLTKALNTLNSAASKPNVSKLIYITNAFNPFNDSISMASLYGRSRKSYGELPETARSIIDGIVTKGGLTNIDKSKLFIYTLPFENAEKDRYKVVLECVKDFIASIKSALSGIAQEVLDMWQQQLFENASLHDTSITVDKRQLMWPLVIIMCDHERENPFEEDIDDAEYEEALQRYHSFITCRSQKFSFVTRVVVDYQNYSKDGIKGRDRMVTFINDKWTDYKDDFTDGETDTITEIVIKITLYRILQQKQFISDVKKRVNLI